MKPIHIIALVLAGLPLGLPSRLGATTITSSSVNISEKAAQLADKDPSGIVLTLTAVLTVFVALLLLVFVFKLLARVMAGLDKPKENAPATQSVGDKIPTKEEQVAIALALQSATNMPDREVSVVIGLALHQAVYSVHDEQNYTLPLRRQTTQWNARYQGMRQYNKTQ